MSSASGDALRFFWEDLDVPEPEFLGYSQGGGGVDSRATISMSSSLLLPLLVLLLSLSELSCF